MWDSLITNHLVPLLPRKWRLPFGCRRYCSAAGVERELIHLQKLASRFRTAMDSGANPGFYKYGAGNIRIFDQGLFSREGEAVLYTPVLENGLQSVDFIKIDVEGHGPEVLRGAAETPGSNRRGLPVESKGHPDEVDSTLEDLGYLRADFTGGGGNRGIARPLLPPSADRRTREGRGLKAHRQQRFDADFS